MTTTMPIKAEISESSVSVGAGHKNTNKIVIKITSDQLIEVVDFGCTGIISLKIMVGKGPEALVATSEEDITIDKPNDWVLKKKFIENQALFNFELPNKSLGPGHSVTVTFKKFECYAAPGQATVEFSSEIDGYDKSGPIILKVEKKGQDFQLLNFEADPPYIITSEDKEKFHLKWITVKAGKVNLYKNNILYETLEEGIKDENGKIHFKNDEEYEFNKDKPSFTTVYKLVGTDETDPSKKTEKELTVQVLTPGWHKVNFERYGYPVSFCNMNDIKLYGIFIKEGKASLYSSQYPLSSWKLESADIPEGMETSPAVCFRNKLWLVGGSTVDPENCSGKVYCYENDSWKAINNVPNEFTDRMGHACFVFRDKIWILGGYDEYHNPLNEVWSFDENGKNWQKKENTPWSPRCMSAATAYNNKIWLYGGVKGPVGEAPMDDMWTMTTDPAKNEMVKWESFTTDDNAKKKGMENPLLPGAGRPIGCSLLVLKERLHLLGAFWRDPIIEARKFVLEDSQKRWRSSEIPETGWLDQAEGNFKLLSVVYRGMVYLTWIDYSLIERLIKKEPDTNTLKGMSLNIYIP